MQLNNEMDLENEWKVYFLATQNLSSTNECCSDTT